MNRLVRPPLVLVIVMFVTVDQTGPKPLKCESAALHTYLRISAGSGCRFPSLVPCFRGGGCEFAITAHFVDCMSVRYLIARSANRRAAAAPPPRPPTD